MLETTDLKAERVYYTSALTMLYGKTVLTKADFILCIAIMWISLRILLLRVRPVMAMNLYSQGIDPEQCSVIGVKAAVAHRRAYDTITHASYTVSTPGPCTSDLKSFPWQHIRRPIFPLDD